MPDKFDIPSVGQNGPQNIQKFFDIEVQNGIGHMSKFEQIMDTFKVALTSPSRIVEKIRMFHKSLKAAIWLS